MPGIIGIPDLLERHFSSSIWLYIFIAAVIYLFFRLKAAYKRALFAAVVGFFLIVNAFVIIQLSELGENATFYRNLWAIPVMTIIGIAIVDIVRIIPKWYLKIPVIAAFAIGLWFVNQHEYIRCRDQYYSSDAKMVSEDVINLAKALDKLQKEEGKETLFVVCPGNTVSELYLYSGFLKVSNSSVLSDVSHDGEYELT